MFGTKSNSFCDAYSSLLVRTYKRIHADYREQMSFNTPAAYSAVPGLEPGNRQAWLRGFMFFLSTCRKMMGWYHKLSCNRFLTLSFQFIIHPKIQHCKLCAADSIIKQNTKRQINIHIFPHIC